MSKPTNHQLIIRACTSLASATLCATIFLTINTNNVKASAIPLPVQSNVEKNVNQANHVISDSNLFNSKRIMPRIWEDDWKDDWQNVNYSYDETTKTLTIKGGTLVIPKPIFKQFAAEANEIQTIKITGKLTLEGSVNSLFYGLKNLKEINGGNNIDTSQVTDMAGMFYYCEKLSKVDVSNWNTSQVTNMADMFNSCSVLDGIDVSNWNTSKVTDMSGMFSGCNVSDGLDVSNWDTSKVTDMSKMFLGCQKLSKVDVGNWNTSKVINMSDMFYYCSALDGIDVSNWNTSKVIDMHDMFANCTALDGLDVGNWDTSQVTDMSFMFNTCSVLDGLDVSNWNTSKVTNMFMMFSSCTALDGLDVSKWVTSKVTNMSWMFDYCQKLSKINVSNWNTSQVTDMSFMFNNCQKLSKIDVSKWNTSQVTDMSFMFKECSALDGLDVSNWDTSQVTDMHQMFIDCSILDGLDVSNWVTSKVTNMSDMFAGCTALDGLDVSNWNTSQVTDMEDMFYHCSVLDGIDVSNWNTNKVTSMQYMFYGCSKISKLDLSNFNDHQLKVDIGGSDGHNKMLGGLSSLVELRLGPNINIAETGLNTLVDWVSVKNGTVQKPKGTEYYSSDDLAKFWNDKNYTETWVVGAKAKITINYIDLDDNNKIIQSDVISGAPAHTVDYKTSYNEIIAELKDKHYEYVASEDKLPWSNGQIQLPDDVTDNTTYTVGFKHATSNVKDGDINPITGDTIAGLNKEIKQTIKYTGAPNNIADNVQTIKFTRGGKVDLITGKVILQDWNEGEQLFKDVDSPKVAGYEPDITTVKGATVKPTDSDVAKEVKYSRGSYNIKIDYVDSNDNNKIIKTDKVSGNPDKVISYQDQLKEILHDLSGYVIDKDKTTLPLDNNNDIKLPDSVTGDKDYQVVLKHDSKTMHAGDKNPVTGKDEDGLAKTITQTIKYTGVPTDISDNVQKVTFKRDADVDMVTGKLTYHDWDNKELSFKDVASPTVTGYDANPSSIKGATVTPDSSDITKTVTYVRSNYGIKINYVDGDDNDNILKTDVIEGNPEKAIAYKDKMNSIISSLTGYVLNKAKTDLPLNSDGDIQLPADVLGNKTYNVVLNHKTATMKPGDKNPVTGKDEDGLTKTITRTIKYTRTPTAISDKVQKVTFTRNATVDLVTGKLTYLAWDNDSQTFDEVVSPKVNGYTANPETVQKQTVKPADNDTIVTVKYTRGSYNINIDYVDSNTGKVVKTDKVSGNPDKVISYQDQLKQILHDLPGYVIDKDKTTLPLDDNNNIKLPNTVTGDKDYQVVLKHDSKTMHAGDKNPVTGKDEDSLTKTITQTIKYTGMPTDISDNVQKVTFKRDADVDMVTGKLTYHDWDNNELAFKDVVSPTVDGYDADISLVKGITVKPTDSDITKTVTYTKKEAPSYEITINYTDDTGKVVKTDKQKGKAGTTIQYHDKLQEIINQIGNGNYEIDKDKSNLPLDDNNDIKLPDDLTSDHDYHVVLKHKIVIVKPGDKNPVTGEPIAGLTKEVKQVIKYTGVNKDIPDNVQTVKFTRNGKVDLVTGKVEYLDWNEKEQSFKDVDSPTVSGYTPDIATVKGTKVTADSNDITKQVIYTKDKNDPDYEITIDYQDENGKTIKTDKQKGKANSTIPYKDRMQEIINSIAKNGYEVDWSKSNLPVDSNGNIKLGAITGDTNYKLVLKHKIVTFKYGEKNPFTGQEDPNLERKVTQTIKYLHSGKNLPNNVQTLTFTRDAQVDMITGKVTYLEWHEGKQTFKDVTSPTVQGYVADLPIVKGRVVTGNSKNIVQLVTYHKSNIVQTGLDLTRNKQTTILGTLIAALVSLLSYFGIVKKQDRKDK